LHIGSVKGSRRRHILRHLHRPVNSRTGRTTRHHPRRIAGYSTQEIGDNPDRDAHHRWLPWSRCAASV